METKSFNLYRYSIPVDSQLILRGRFLKRREGLIVRVACSRDGWGEIAPLPGFSEETLDQAQEQANNLPPSPAFEYISIFISFILSPNSTASSYSF